MDIYSFFVFLMALWVVGKVSVQLKIPSVVGEILAGLILGPHLLHLAPYSDVLKMIGECGLILLVIEAGIEVDLDMLKLIGPRGFLVAVFGSMTPLAIGFGLGLATGAETTSALAIGACLAPTSMGIAVSALRRGKQLNTPIGQLVIAAAVLDDIISLILLSIIQALGDPTPWNLAKPLVVSSAFLLSFGYLAIFIMPKLFPRILALFDPKVHEYVILSLVMSLALGLIPATNYAGTSYLLGSFLAGLAFCSDHHVHKVWNKQMKRLMAWLLRLFFACTIGFEVPIKDVWTKEIISKTFLFFVPIVGKLATGIFAPAPWRFIDACKLGSAMSAWGEFAFIIATASKNDHLLDSSQFSSCVMAVLLSVIFGPILLTYAINVDNAAKGDALDEIKMANEEIMIHESMTNYVYYKIRTESKGFWGFYQKIEARISSLELDIQDYRVNHSYDGRRLVTTEFYVRDETMYRHDKENMIEKRRRAIAGNVGRALMDPDCNVSVTQWIPRIRQGPSSRRRSSIIQLGQTATEKPLRLSVIYKRRHCCRPTDQLTNVAEQMVSEDLPAMLVIDPKSSKTKPTVVGMVTRSDIVRDIPKHGIEEHHLCKDIMNPTKNLLVCDKNASRQEILVEMANGDCQNMVLIDVGLCEVHAVSNIKEICAFIVQPMQANDIGSMTNVLAGHYNDVYDSEEEEFNYRLGVQGMMPNSNLPLDGHFHDGQPVTWDAWEKITSTGSIRMDSGDASSLISALDLDDIENTTGFIQEYWSTNTADGITSTGSMADVMSHLEASDDEDLEAGGNIEMDEFDEPATASHV